MKYKIGDKVRIKTWENMKKEFGVNSKRIQTSINSKVVVYREMYNNLMETTQNREVTISHIQNVSYNFKEVGFHWSEDTIECLIDEYLNIETISRFEILDIR